MRIKSLSPLEHRRGFFQTVLEDGRRLTVSEDEVIRFTLQVGAELSEEEWERLTEAASISHAKDKAVRLVSSRPRSKKQLTRKLVEHGAATEEAQAAVDWLEELGVVDDAAYAAALVRHYSARGYGAARIRQELRHRGVDRDLWEEALSQLPDSSELLPALVRKLSRGDLSDPRQRKRVQDALLRRGFSYEEIRQAMGSFDREFD